MKHLSQTLKIALALFVAVFANGTLPTLTAYAMEPPATTETSIETETTDITNDQDLTDNTSLTPDTEKVTPEEQDSDDPAIESTIAQVVPEQKSVHLRESDTCKKEDISIVTKNANMTTATVKLTNYAAAHHKVCVVSLNSYETDGPSWATSGTQVFIDHDQVTLSKYHPLGHLSVKSPKCFGQTDLYLGSMKYDGRDGPLPHYPDTPVPVNNIAYWNGGKKCEVPPKKVTICHRTGWTHSPYVKTSVDQNAADGIAGNNRYDADHYTEHQGPIYYDGIKTKWGDIIPPIVGVHAGYNWTTQGQFVYQNDCEVPAKTEVKVWVKSCDRIKSATDSVVVTVKNPYDKTRADVTYTVTLGSVSQTITVEDGKTGTITFSAMVSGSYILQVSGTDGTHYIHKGDLKVEACLVTVEPPVVIDCDKVTIPKDTNQVHYVESYTGTSRIVTATAQGNYWLDDGKGNAVKSIVFTLDFSNLDCGKGEVTPTPPVTPLPTPTELPHTGGNGWSNLLVALVSAAAVYGAVYFAQPKRA